MCIQLAILLLYANFKFCLVANLFRSKAWAHFPFCTDAEKPLQAVQSNDQSIEEPIKTVAFSFNSSAFSNDNVHTAFVRIHRHPVSLEEVESLNCDQSDLKMQLYLAQSELDDNKQMLIFERSIKLSSTNLANDEWLNFQNITSLLEEAISTNSPMKLRLAMGGDCAGISPTQFGVSLDQYPELIAYCNSEEENSVLPALVSEYQRKRRQTTLNSGSGDEPREVENRVPTTIDEIKSAECQLHDFNVSISTWFQISLVYSLR